MTRRATQHRRGQAALEYLVTYGWGILAVLVAVGALSYFGLFDVERYLPNRCAFGAQLECADYQLQAPSDASYGGTVSLQLRNNFGESILITNTYIAATAIEPKNIDTPAEKLPAIAAGNVSVPFSIEVPPLTSALLVGDDRQSITVTIEFERASPAGPKHNVTGELFGTVLAAPDTTRPPSEPPEEPPEQPPEKG